MGLFLPYYVKIQNKGKLSCLSQVESYMPGTNSSQYLSQFYYKV